MPPFGDGFKADGDMLPVPVCHGGFAVNGIVALGIICPPVRTPAFFSGEGTFQHVIDQAVHTPIDKKLLCANLQPRCEVLGEIPEQLDFFDAMPEYDVSLYTNKKQKTTPESAKEALEALLPVLSDEALDFTNRDAVFDACKAKAEELGKKNGWLLYPLGIALSGKQRTPGGGTDLACMMGRETTLARVKAAIEKLNG